MNSLIKLDLSNNLICNIQNIALIDMPSLRYLLLAYNLIVSVKPLRKCVLPNLVLLNICNNKIKDFSCLTHTNFKSILTMQLAQQDKHIQEQITQINILKGNFPTLQLISTSMLQFAPQALLDHKRKRIEQVFDSKYQAIFVNTFNQSN